MDFLNVTDPFQNIGDVINASFLYIQFLCGLVDIKDKIFLRLDEGDETFGQNTESVLSFATAFQGCFSITFRGLVRGN